MSWFSSPEFKWLNKQGVESKKGFAVQFTGRFSAEYREGGQVITLAIEDGLSNGKHCVIIDPDSLQHWDGGSSISDEKKKSILANLRRAVEFQSLALSVEKPLSFRDHIASQREQYLSFLRAGKSVTFNGTEIRSESDLDAFLEKLDAI